MSDITCTCGETFAATLRSRFDLSDGEEARQSLFDGSLLSLFCPACETEIKLEYPSLVTLGEAGPFLLVPERDRSGFWRAPRQYDFGDLGEGLNWDSPTLRIVIGYHELVEKVRLTLDQLDDVAVEMVKYPLLKRALDAADVAESVRIYFSGMADDALEFQIHGLKGGQTGVTCIPQSLYTRFLGDLTSAHEQPEVAEFVAPPYVNVHRLLRL